MVGGEAWLNWPDVMNSPCRAMYISALRCAGFFTDSGLDISVRHTGPASQASFDVWFRKREDGLNLEKTFQVAEKMRKKENGATPRTFLRLGLGGAYFSYLPEHKSLWREAAYIAFETFWSEMGYSMSLFLADDSEKATGERRLKLATDETLAEMVYYDWPLSVAVVARGLRTLRQYFKNQ